MFLKIYLNVSITRPLEKVKFYQKEIYIVITEEKY